MAAMSNFYFWLAKIKKIFNMVLVENIVAMENFCLRNFDLLQPKQCMNNHVSDSDSGEHLVWFITDPLCNSSWLRHYNVHFWNMFYFTFDKG